MFTHYLLIATRNLARHRFSALVSVVGLALGLACFIGASMFASYVESADGFFPSSDRIYAAYQASEVKQMGLSLPFDAGVTPLLAERLRIDYPQLEAVARARVEARAVVVARGRRSFERVHYVEPEFLTIFELPFVAGTKADTLAAARTALLTAEAAQSLFGTVNALGETLRVGELDIEVAAIIHSLPSPSHLAGTFGDGELGIVVVTQVREDLDGLMPGMGNLALRWLGFARNVHTYVLFPESGSLTPSRLNTEFPRLVERHVPVLDDSSIAFEVRHVSELVAGDLDTLMGPFTEVGMTDLLQWLGALVLATACVNFVNLTTARAAVRGKEIGLRKTLGARRGQVVAQHLCEAVLVAALAAGIALAAVHFGVAAVNAAADLNLASPLQAGVRFWMFVVALTLATGTAGGLSPALVLARVRPIQALRAGALRVGSSMLRTVLIALQFAVASFLLIAVLIVTAQNAELARSGPSSGPDPIVVVTTTLQEAGIDAEQLRRRLEASPHVTAVTGANVAPWEGVVSGTGFSREPNDVGNFRFTQSQRVSYEYFTTLGTKTLAGRVFSRDHGDGDAAATEPRIVIDRLAAEQFGWEDPAAAVGERLYESTVVGEARAATIIGVVEHEPPRVFGWGSRAFVYVPDFDGITYPIVRVARDNIAAALADIDAAWAALAREVPISREFLDERFESSYRMFRVVTAGFTAVAAVAFMIACVGLLGVVTFVASRRRHEMGVRKVLGASSPMIMRLLLWQFLRPVLIANIAVWPLALIAAKLYVDLFIRPAALTPLPFLLSLATTLLVTGGVVLAHAVSSARLKPAVVLRYE